MRSPRKPYQGNKRGLLLAFDIGTTYSGVSYAKLEPGVPPEIKTVTRFPSKAEAGADAKVPTVIYYDNNGNAQAIGAATILETTLDQAEEQGWFKAEWFKLHFRPKNSSAISHELPPLPPNKQAVDVFADFLRYLLACTKTFITEHDANPAYWESISENIIFIITHPNGWQLEQQNAYRRAAVKAGLIGDAPRFRERLQFVTEGEASLHYCIHQGLREHVDTQDGSQKGIVIVDAGGGTLDVSAYRTTSNAESSHPEFEEMCVPHCHVEGSVMVTVRAKEYIYRKLCGSQFEDDIEIIIKGFDSTAKHTFSSPDAAALVRFGNHRKHNPALNVTNGKFKIPGETMSEFFETSVTSIINTIRGFQSTASVPISTVFLVGGFAASEYLFSKLQQFANVENIHVCRPDEHVNKAVAAGAASYHLDHYVESRAARDTYGLIALVPYDKTNSRHKERGRKHQVQSNGGTTKIDQFSILIVRGTVVSETKEFRRSYIREARRKIDLFDLKIPLYTYLGAETDPQRIEIESHPELAQSYTISADLSSYACTLPARRGDLGRLYFVAEFDVILLLGATELKAQVAWKERNEWKRSPAEIVYH